MVLMKELIGIGVKVSCPDDTATFPPSFGNGVVSRIRHRCGCELSHGPSPEDKSGSGEVPNLISAVPVADNWYDAEAVGEKDV